MDSFRILCRSCVCKHLAESLAWKHYSTNVSNCRTQVPDPRLHVTNFSTQMFSGLGVRREVRREAGCKDTPCLEAVATERNKKNYKMEMEINKHKIMRGISFGLSPSIKSPCDFSTFMLDCKYPSLYNSLSSSLCELIFHLLHILYGVTDISG